MEVPSHAPPPSAANRAWSTPDANGEESRALIRSLSHVPSSASAVVSVEDGWVERTDPRQPEVSRAVKVLVPRGSGSGNRGLSTRRARRAQRVRVGDGSQKRTIEVENAAGAAAPEGGKSVKHRSQYQRDVFLFSCLAGFAMLETLYQEMVLSFGIAGCGRAQYFGEDCATLLSLAERYPRLLLQLVVYMVALSFHVSHFKRIRRCRRAVKAGRHSAPENLTPKQIRQAVGHWTPVASREQFAETVTLLTDAQLVVVMVVIPATVLGTLALLRNSNRYWDPENYPDYAETLKLSCCPAGEQWGPSCSTLCQLGLTKKEGLVTLTSGLLISLSVTVVFHPVQLWSSLTVMAVKKTHEKRVMRTLLMSATALILCGYHAVLFTLFVGLRMYGTLAVPEFWMAYFVALVIITVLLCITLLWSIGVATIFSVPGRLLMQTLVVLQGLLRLCRGIRYPQQPRTGGHRPMFLLCRMSCRYRQLVLLYCCMYVFAVDVLSLEGDSRYEIWILRLVPLLLLIFTRDEPATFSSLDEHAPGFGLVVNARHLRKAIQLHLAGKPPLKQVLSYRATMIRMNDTLAVSYRWQAEEVEIAPGLTLNMTDWQMSKLADAISQTKSLYVWLDKCSVPSAAGALKRTLLARMMAVYASASITLVLRSVELDGDRYHQRVWTLQEYCSSSSIMIETQPDRTSQDGRFRYTSLVEGEDAMYKSLREQHLSRQFMVLPLWLTSAEGAINSFSAEEAVEVCETFTELQETLNCLYQKDLIRALYPLLWNIPAEREEELVKIVDAIQSVHGIQQAAQRLLLKNSSTMSDLAP